MRTWSSAEGWLPSWRVSAGAGAVPSRGLGVDPALSLHQDHDSGQTVFTRTAKGLFIASAAPFSGSRVGGRVAPQSKGGSRAEGTCSAQLPLPRPLDPSPWQGRPSPSPPPPCALSACSGSGWNGRTGGGLQPSSARAKGAPQVPGPNSLGHAAPAGTQLCTMPCSPVTCNRSKPCSKMKTLPT